MIFGVTENRAEGKGSVFAPALTPAMKGLKSMTEADSVHSTPRRTASKIDPPVDPKRRRFLSTAAGVGTPDATDLLRVGSLELDLVSEIDRPARLFGKGRRGDRSFDLRPREFRLLKYMMQRAGQLLTREALLKDVWHYKFIPETTILVDVHMGRLRRKVDGPNETPMIRSVRGAGFILNAIEDAARELDRARKAVQS